ncbi:DUF5994 family protein [Mycolicibacterium litorale]|uniref:Uncharacterized protein n=1 Tax=Mycolicibacterium litorale TaxID=758802 RepID=A0AAD1II25_9MYCO|nr:DUF5994 family protein [Mycolicibacterium litorale]MCV7414838.1 hypothetical protein [Mycolicibacterium litorale]TDY08085.1 hypothetical protein BCL50_0147 [Mycolicibacterium litorale]BBY16007.1 hypothetical protein MLIT_15990 [Mycolicibacterium litorale]
MTPIDPCPPDSGRLTICDRAPIPGGVDGAWWPRSADLGDELSDVLAVLSRLIGPIRRVVYDTAAWTSAPSRVMHRNHAVAVDAYRLVASDTLYLVGTHSRDALLYVIASDVPAPTARSVLDTVGAGKESIGVTQLRRMVHGQPAPTGHWQEGAAL